MTPIEIVDPDDIEFTVKVKGRKPLTFSVPRYDYVEPDVYHAMLADIAAIDNDPDVKPYDRGRLTSLSMLKRFVTDSQYTILEGLKTGHLDQIVRAWSERSAISLPEYLASSASLTENTVGPSDTTSSPEPDTGTPTLAAV